MVPFILPSPDGVFKSYIAGPSVIAASALERATGTDRLVGDALPGGSLGVNC